MVKKVKQHDSSTKSEYTYKLVRSEGWGLMVESSISFDRAIISLTTAFLGFIFIFMKSSQSGSCCVLFLGFILVCLMVSIFSSLLSFWFDQLYGDSIMIYADKFYNDNMKEYGTKKHWSYYASMIAKITSGLLFFLSLVLFSIFFLLNFKVLA